MQSRHKNPRISYRGVSFEIYISLSHFFTNSTDLFRRHGELVLFSGGMQRATYGDRHTIAVTTKEKHVVFDFTSKIIDFFTIFPKEEEGNNENPVDPEALIVLAEEELVAIDLTNPEWKMMALPYLVSLHASSVSILK